MIADSFHKFANDGVIPAAKTPGMDNQRTGVFFTLREYW